MKAKIGEWIEVNHEQGFLEVVSGEVEIIRLLGHRHLFSREIELPADWYALDLGPLLGFWQKKPVALIPVAPGRYSCLEPESGEHFIVTGQTAEGFASQAFVFTQVIPETVSGLWGWFKWSVRLSWKRDYWLLLLCCFIAGLIPVVVPLVTQIIFSDIIPGHDKKALLLVVQVMFVTAVSGALINLVRGLTVMRLKNHIRIVAEPALWMKLLSLPAAFFRRYQIGDLAQRMQGISSLSNQLSSAAVSGIFNGVFCFWNLLVMLHFSYQLTFLAAFIWCVFLFSSLLFSWWQVKCKREQTEAAGKVSGVLLQILTGLNKFRLRGAEERAFYLWAQRFSQSWKWNRRARWQDIWLGLISSAQPLVLNFCIFYYTMSLYDTALATGEVFLSTADFLCFNAAMSGFAVALLGLRSGITCLWGLKPILTRVLPILQESSEISEHKIMAPELSGDVVVSKVSFRYKPNTPLVLKEINLQIKNGSFVAVVGNSGCGKSTLLRLLLGLEKPENGAVLYDGLELSQMDVSSVRRQLGVVLQHSRLQTGSILSNITGDMPFTLEEAWKVAKQVGLDADIRELPMGMHTMIGEGGSTFSGGQRQRLLIARAIAQRPRLIIFDEATSSLDNETQAIVANTLANLHCTRIVVAHRLSTIKNADKIVVLDRGEIIEEGTYGELLKKQGAFSRLAARQLD